MKYLNCISIIAMLFFTTADAQSIKDSFTFTESTSGMDGAAFLVIKNINGNVSVTGYDGIEIVIQVSRKLWSKQGNISPEIQSEYQVKTNWYQGNLYVYVITPKVHPEFYNNGLEYHMHRKENSHIDFEFDIAVKVPQHILVKPSTINGGEVLVKNLSNGVHASNVNGQIKLQEIAGPTKASTVNGNIEVWFSKSPQTNTQFNTVNGTIEIFSPADLSAVVTFESVHGELYTDFDNVTRLPNQLNKEKDGRGHRYHISNFAPIQIGNGGPTMSFTMVNGSAYIKERKS